MARALILAIAVACTPVWAQAPSGPDGATTWFTIVGNPVEADTDVIQVDPRPIATHGELRRMRVRLNRAKLRINPRGIAYRSYMSEVEFNCATGTTRLIVSQFFDGPLWTGPSRRLVYQPGEVIPLEFRMIEPNPRDRVVSAVCGAAKR